MDKRIRFGVAYLAIVLGIAVIGNMVVTYHYGKWWEAFDQAGQINNRDFEALIDQRQKVGDNIIHDKSRYLETDPEYQELGKKIDANIHFKYPPAPVSPSEYNGIATKIGVLMVLGYIIVALALPQRKA